MLTEITDGTQKLPTYSQNPTFAVGGYLRMLAAEMTVDTQEFLRH